MSRVDEHFERYIQQSLFAFNKDSVLEIFRTLLTYQGPYREPEATKRTLRQIVLHAANREYACIALAILGSRFAACPGMREWFYELVGTANRPELRGLAVIAVTETPDDNIIDFIEDRIFTSNWPLIRKFALYALGMLDLEESDHLNRMNILIHFIKETPSYDLIDHALWIMYGCAKKSDRGTLGRLLSDKLSMKINNSYFMQRIENIEYSPH